MIGDGFDFIQGTEDGNVVRRSGAGAGAGGSGGRGWARAVEFGVDLSDSRSVLFFCFKFWQQLSCTPLDLDAPLTPLTPNPLLYPRHENEANDRKHFAARGGESNSQ